MAYRRQIPRDLFNEANLLKCYGQIYINLETASAPDAELVHKGNSFEVEEEFGSGGTYLSNVTLFVKEVPCKLYRTLNSREPWPLYLVTSDEEEIDVFDATGAFSAEMLEFLRA